MKRHCILAGLAALLSGGCCDGTSPNEAKHAAAPAARDTGPAFTDSDGKQCYPLAADGRTATVLLFLMHDCPVANASAPALGRLVEDFGRQGVRFFGVYATETAGEVNTHRRDYALPFPGIVDPVQELARRTGATRVPEAAVLSPAGELLYRGRIDDRAVSPGVTRPQPRHEDLRRALEAVMAGQKPDPQFTEAVGCYLPDP